VTGPSQDALQERRRRVLAELRELFAAERNRLTILLADLIAVTEQLMSEPASPDEAQVKRDVVTRGCLAQLGVSDEAIDALLAMHAGRGHELPSAINRRH
jgi:hypothetical protein